MDKYLGKRLDGRYEIHELLGVGGMAYVYRAFDKDENRWVAIKILKDEFSGNSEFLRRFRNESRAIAVLSHPNIVKVYDVSFGDCIQYIVMELIDGITLKDYISHNGPLPWKEAIHFTAQILRALQHAHDKGIIHRDVKPQNIMLLQDGTIKVTDFGIARFSQSETQTMTDKALGSVHYIAPEQARGDFTSDKVDIYSVGVMLYEMLTGQLPFEADNAVSVAIMQLQAEPTKPRIINPQIPVGLEEVTMKAMQKNPAARFQSAAEMLGDIERFRLNPAITFTYNYSQDMDATRHVDFYEGSQQPQKRYAPPSYNDNYEYEEELVKAKKHAKGSMVVTGIIAAVVIAAICFGVYFVFNAFKDQEKEDDQIDLPTFVGMNYESEIKGKYKDFVFTITPGDDSSKEAGVVLQQSPSGGLKVKKGKEVFLTVNKYGETEEPVVIPEFKGEQQNDAFNQLKEMGLVPKLEMINDEQTATGYVIKTDPAAGSTVNKGDTVTVYVSKGPATEQATVPDILDISLEEAKSLLTQSGLRVGDVTYDDESDKSKDTVLNCSPEVGKKINKDSAVNLVVSSGKKDEKTINAEFPLPAGVNKDISLKIYREGVLVEEQTVNPYYVSRYNTTFVGTPGTEDIVIQLDGQDYIYATLNFDDEDMFIKQQFPFIAPPEEPTPSPTPSENPSQPSNPSSSDGSGEGAGQDQQ